MTQTPKTMGDFRSLVAANRSAGRLTEPVAPDASQKFLQTGMRLLPAELAHARQLAWAEERSVARFLRRVYLCGLKHYPAERGDAADGQ